MYRATIPQSHLASTAVVAQKETDAWPMDCARPNTTGTGRRGITTGGRLAPTGRGLIPHVPTSVDLVSRGRAHHSDFIAQANT